MATEVEIRVVREMLGPDAAAGGWDSTRIGADLDAGMHRYAIAEAWWRYRAAHTANLTSMSESGSSRQLREIHQNAVALADKYAALLAEATAPPGGVTVAPRFLRTHPIRRIER